MKIGTITCLGLAAMALLSAAVVFTSKGEDIEAKEREIRSSITLFDNKKMYSDAVSQYKALTELDPENYDNLIEYRDYCLEHGFSTECANASLRAINLKEQNGEIDFTSSKLYLQWLDDSDSKSIYSFVKDCINKFSGEEKQYFSDFYDSIKGEYISTGSRYVEFGEWHNNFIRQDSAYYYGNEQYAFAKDRDGNYAVISGTGEVKFTAPEIMSYSAGKNLVAAHHEDQLVYLNISRERKIVPYNETENRLLDYDYLGAYYNNIANFSNDGKWGYINGNADVITDRYEYATAFINGVAAVKEGGTWQFITISDNQIVALDNEKFDDVMLDEYGCPFSYGYAYVKKSGSDKWSLISLTISEEEKKVVGIRHIGSLEFDDAKPFGTYGAVQSNGKWGFIDANGEWALEPTFDEAGSMACGLAPVKLDGKWGYADINGKIIIEAEFEDATAFNINGYAATQTNGIWRMIKLREYAD